MDITFNDYIQNPMSRENAVFSHRGMYRDLYTNKLDTLLVRENGKIEYHLYNTIKKDKYFIHMKIPSEVIPNFYYDTVIEFYTKDKSKEIGRSIADYNVKFYSNDPSFVFTFAHSFIKNKLFIEDLVTKMSKEAVKKVAVQKNPSNQVGYVKSIYFAYLIIKRDGLFNKVKFESEGQTYDKTRFLETIEHADKKVQDRINKQEDINKAKKIDRKKEKIQQNTLGQNINNNIRTTSPNRKRNISTVSVIGASKKSNNIVQSKRVKRK